MNPGDDVVQLLLDMGALSRDDLKGIHAAQGEALLQLLVQKRIIQRGQSEGARGVLEKLVGTTNPTARAEAQLELYGLITEQLDSRTAEAHKELQAHIALWLTSRNWPQIVLENE